MSVRRIIAGLATASLLLVAAATPALADASATVGEVEANDGQLSFVVTLDAVPTDADIDTDNASASLEGQPLSPDVESLSDAGEISQTALLVMDTSDSMAGENLTAAKDAARQFVDSVPSEVEIGLVTFDSVAELQVAPTSSRSDLLAAIDGLTTAPKTVLYDAVVLAAQELEAADVGSALLLSDGADRGGDATLAQATKAAEKSDARFDVVSFGDSTGQVSALTEIAEATDGTVYQAADTDALIEAFDAAAETITNRFLFTASLPDGYVQNSGTLAVSVPVAGVVVADTAQVVVGETSGDMNTEIPPPSPAPEPGPLASIADEFIWLALIGVFVALAILVFFAIAATTNRDPTATRTAACVVDFRSTPWVVALRSRSRRQRSLATRRLPEAPSSSPARWSQSATSSPSSAQNLSLPQYPSNRQSGY